MTLNVGGLGENPTQYTRFMFANDVLAAIGNTNPSLYTQNWMVCWTTFETSFPKSASYNLLNTTMQFNGSVGGGSQGNIQYYKQYSDGITATALTLLNGNYPHLLQALQSNDQSTLSQAGSTSVSNDLGTWGTGHASDIAQCANNGGTQAQNQTFGPSSSNGSGSGGGGTGLTTNFPGGGIGNPIQPIIDWFQSLQPLWDWLGNPVRLFKLIAGIGLIMLGLIMLVAPDTIKTVAKHPEMLLA